MRTLQLEFVPKTSKGEVKTVTLHLTEVGVFLTSQVVAFAQLVEKFSDHYVNITWS